jgi:hypothetical protein
LVSCCCRPVHAVLLSTLELQHHWAAKATLTTGSGDNMSSLQTELGLPEGQQSMELELWEADVELFPEYACKQSRFAGIEPSRLT